MASLSLRGIRKQLGANPILRGIDLEVADGELAVLVGPSGCGKSTLLRTVAGLEEPDDGAVHIGDRDVTRAAPRDRDVAMVFQSYALYPHLTVRDNLAFGMRLRGESEATITKRIDEVGAMLGLAPLLARFPREMSGGQRQRVAMGRAIARRPALFLFDEPLSNLDAALRAQVRVDIKKLHAQLKATMLYVTHDQVEAMTLADRLVVLNGGRVEQQGPPLDVYHRPATKFVAAFLGSPAMNFVEGKVAERGETVEADGLSVRVDRTRFANLEAGRTVTVGIRPHDVIATGERDRSITLGVDVIEAMGFEAYAHGTVGKVSFVARLESDAKSLPREGDRITLRVEPETVHLFDPESGHSLSSGDAG